MSCDEEDEEQVIDIRAVTGGDSGEEFIRPVTIIEESDPPLDITNDTVKLSLGSRNAPGVPIDPDVDTPGADAAGIAAGVQNTRTVSLFIGSTLRPATGYYWVYSHVNDGPEVVIRRHQRVTILNDD